MRTTIILGLLFGDEGKGLTTSCISSDKDLVIRFNGGHNAGHTVEKNGYRHIFSSFGSGTLNGSDTYISEYCCIYPKAILREQQLLIKNGFKTNLFVHPLAPVTTPFDVHVNRDHAIKTNHGSVGVGVGHTFKRHYESPYKLHAFELFYPDLLIRKLYGIAEYCKAENVYNSITDFLEICSRIKIKIKSLDSIKDNYEQIIFEGAQGIALDQDFGFFPNVTRSYCTSRNAIELCNKYELNIPNIIYCMRSYLTRHGNGFMPNETKNLCFEDETNKSHQYQGEFRQGYHSSELIRHSLNADKIYSAGFQTAINITCLNQTDNLILIDNSKISLREFTEMFNLKKVFYSQNKQKIKVYETITC